MSTTPFQPFDAFTDLAKATTGDAEAVPTAPARSPGLKDAAFLESRPGRLPGAYNRCSSCGLVTKDAKYCPYCGPELEHVGPTARCRHCTEQVTFADARFCGWCGKELAP